LAVAATAIINPITQLDPEWNARRAARLPPRVDFVCALAGVFDGVEDRGVV